MTFRLTEIDELTRPNHYYLDNDDNCYFFGEYTARKGFNFSFTNQLIHNLKKSVDKHNTPQYRYKISAINNIAEMLAQIKGSEHLTYVPVPPSKSKDDPLYDDRMIQILEKAKKKNSSIDYREMVYQKESRDASHCSEHRATVEDIIENYEFDSEIAINHRETIVIFDDVLTAGSHYSAMKTLILTNLPNVAIVGLFIARTVRDDKVNWFDDLEDDLE